MVGNRSSGMVSFPWININKNSKIIRKLKIKLFNATWIFDCIVSVHDIQHEENVKVV